MSRKGIVLHVWHWKCPFCLKEARAAGASGTVCPKRLSRKAKRHSCASIRFIWACKEVGIETAGEIARMAEIVETRRRGKS